MHLRFLILCAASVAITAAADVRVVEEIVAKVNGEIITRTELDRTRQGLEAELRQQGLSGEKFAEVMKQSERDALRDQIDTLLLVQRARDLSINVDPDVTRRVAEIQSQSKIVDPDKFHAWIHEQTGMTFEDFRARMKNQILTQRVVGQEISSRVAIPEAEKRKYYEEHKQEFVREEMIFLRQIVISTEGKNPQETAAAEKKAKEVVDRAKKGEKFGELARDHSDDTATARNFGELPPFKRGQLRKEIEDVVFAQRKGYITDLIRIPNGFLILRVEERFEPGQASYEEIENEITERLSMPKIQPRVRELLTKLRNEAFLEIREGYVDSAAAPGKDTSWKDPAQLKPETVTKEEVAAQKKRRLLWVIPLPGSSGDKQEKEEAVEATPPAKPPKP
jgi:parvulin-like peptidyl-prolyl isomerase